MGHAIVINGDFTAYVCDSAAMRPSSQITLRRHVVIITEMACTCCVDIELVKDSNTLRLPGERYSPVRRLSDGLTMVRKYRSQLEKIYKKALQNQVN